MVFAEECGIRRAVTFVAGTRGYRFLMEPPLEVNPGTGLRIINGAAYADWIAARSPKELNSSGLKLETETRSKTIAMGDVTGPDEVGAVKVNVKNVNAIKATVVASVGILSSITSGRN